MALSLVGDYGGSGSSSEESEEEPEEEEKPTKPQISLPSAADMFDSVDTSSASFMSAPVAAGDVPLTTPKRKKTDGDGGGKSSGNKKSKDSKGAAAGSGSGGAGGASSSSNKGLIPPQMSRPNIVTEDSALWSSDASMKRQRQGEADRRGAAAAKGKGAKDSLTFKQREKASGGAKRDKGQASRGKSYVEEEKRLLRELGSS
ncbi:unnamed protein product [Hapterophycus canaliculatus]